MTGPEMAVVRHGLEPIDSLAPFPGNARRGDVAAIAKSLARSGQYRSIVANIGTLTGRPREILGGHHVVAALESLGRDAVLVDWVDVDDQTARVINLADNRLSELAAWDQDALLAALQAVEDLEGTGYLIGDVDALAELLAGHVWDPDEDDQEVIDELDRDGWPEIRAKVPPDVHERFLAVPGKDDAERITGLVSIRAV